MVQTIIDYILQFYLYYIAGGVAYAVGKWIFLLFKLRGRVNDITEARIESRLKDFQRHTRPQNYTREDALQNLRESAAQDIFYPNKSYPPLVSENKARLLGWAIFWPFNLVWTLVADVAKEAFTFIYRKFGDMLQHLSNSILPK